MPKNIKHPPIKELKEIFLNKYTKNLGFAAFTCKEIGICYQTFQKWFKTDDIFRSKILEVDELKGDFVENKLLENIKNNDTVAILFYLKCKRGWRDRQVIEVSGEIDHNVRQIQINVMDTDTKQLMEDTIKLIDLNEHN